MEKFWQDVIIVLNFTYLLILVIINFSNKVIFI